MPEYMDGKLVLMIRDGADQKRVSELLNAYNHEDVAGGILYSLDVPKGEEQSCLENIQTNFSDIISASSRIIKRS